MLVHSVYFWLKDGLDAEQQKAFRAGLESLGGIPGVAEIHVGIPADTPARPVVDHSYTFGLVVVLKDLDAHDAYQTHPLHKAFLERFSACWSKVLVYDVI